MYRGIRKQRSRVTASTGAVVIKSRAFQMWRSGPGSCKQEEWEEKQVSSIDSSGLFSLV